MGEEKRVIEMEEEILSTLENLNINTSERLSQSESEELDYDDHRHHDCGTIEGSLRYSLSPLPKSNITDNTFYSNRSSRVNSFSYNDIFSASYVP